MFTRFELLCTSLSLCGAAFMLNVAWGVPGADLTASLVMLTFGALVTLGGLLALPFCNEDLV
jgi:hypothetical protein